MCYVLRLSSGSIEENSNFSISGESGVYAKRDTGRGWLVLPVLMNRQVGKDVLRYKVV